MALRTASTLTLVALSLHAGQAIRSIYEQTAIALQRGDISSALQLIEPAAKRDPKDLRALTLLGMALTAAGSVKQANQTYQQALALNPRYAPALRALAINEMAAGNAAAARTQFEALLSISPAEPAAHVALAEITYNERRYAEALRHFEQSNGAYAADTRNILKLADAAIQTGQPQKAETALDAMPAGADPEQHLQAGLMLARLAKYEAASREFEIAANGRDKYLAGYNLALARLKSGQQQRALEAVQALIAKGFRTAELYNLQAHAYEKSGRTREAYESLRTATQIDPGDETNYLDLIAICLEHKNLDLAILISEIGLRVLPKSDRLQLQKGVAYAMKGEFEQARAALASAAELAPAKGLPKIALALVLLQTDQSEQAAASLRTGTPGDADRYLFQWFLAEALSRIGAEPGSPDERDAVKGLQQCVQEHPDIAQPRILLGKFLARRGEWPDAIRELERALVVEPENSTAMYQLAQAYRKTGDKRASELFAKVSKAKADERDSLTRKGLALITERSK